VAKCGLLSFGTAKSRDCVAKRLARYQSLISNLAVRNSYFSPWGLPSFHCARTDLNQRSIQEKALIFLALTGWLAVSAFIKEDDAERAAVGRRPRTQHNGPLRSVGGRRAKHKATYRPTDRAKHTHTDNQQYGHAARFVTKHSATGKHAECYHRIWRLRPASRAMAQVLPVRASGRGRRERASALLPATRFGKCTATNFPHKAVGR